jgi:protoporphyrin/coproporphyrin ferrochelatase
MKSAVLLVNLGSPASTSIPDVRRYLDQFLMDPYVIDVPWALRALIVKGFILPTRPPKTAHAYQSIWTPEGSPLVVISEQTRRALDDRLQRPVGLAMRYGEPSIPDAVAALARRATDCDEIVVVPLYPQYAMATSKTVEVEALPALRATGMPFRFVPPFYADDGYLNAMESRIRRGYPNDVQYLLFSYHGIPARHLHKTDPTHRHCLTPNCCTTPSPAHATCYRHQSIETTEHLARRLDLAPGQYGFSFQSRLGSGWLEPFTDVLLDQFPSRGITRLAIVCPSFVADCLETLEEIAIRGRASFLAAGGESLHYVPCLNGDPLWIEALAALCK